jgi:hypothetical protein
MKIIRPLPIPAGQFVVLLILLALLLPVGSAWAQIDEDLVPFECSGDAYTVRANPATLFRINQDVMPFVFEEIAPMLGPFGPGGSLIPIQVNNIGYDVVENVLYGVAIPVLNPGVIQDNFGIVKIDSIGQVVPVPSTLPGGVRFLAGDVSTDGSTLYMNSYPSGSNMYVADLDTLTITNVPLIGGPLNVADWAYNPLDGMLYGAVGRGPTAITGAPVYMLNPNTGVISLVGFPPGLPLANSGDGQYYGGAWFAADGTLVLYRNSDEIYEIDLAGPTVKAAFPGAAGSSQFNDAAACAAINPPLIDKFYTYTNNDWSLRCAEYEDVIDSITGEVTTVCVEYRLPNTGLDDDIFADDLPQNGEGQFVLVGKERRQKTVVNPGQYIAVSNIDVFSSQDIWVLEDFSDCTEIGTVNPFSVPGGVQVVLIDSNGDVHDIDDDLAAGIGGYITLTEEDALVHVEDVIAGSTLRVMVKFKPSDALGIIGLSCINHEILLDETGEELRRASAGLIIE